VRQHERDGNKERTAGKKVRKLSQVNEMVGGGGASCICCRGEGGGWQEKRGR